MLVVTDGGGSELLDVSKWLLFECVGLSTNSLENEALFDVRGIACFTGGAVSSRHCGGGTTTDVEYFVCVDCTRCNKKTKYLPARHWQHAADRRFHVSVQCSRPRTTVTRVGWTLIYGASVTGTQRLRRWWSQ